jgi:AraC-like DNA-binding protein
MPRTTPAERLFVRLDDDPLYAPETTVPAGTMREFAVPAALREHVAHVMSYEETLPPGVEAVERVLPDGALRLIFDLGDGPPDARVAGPSTRPVLLTMRGHLHGLSVTLRPGAALALFGASAHELAERVVPWADLVGAAPRALGERLAEARDDGARAAMLLDTLHALLRDTDADDRHRARLAAAQFQRAGTPRSVRAVADGLGIGERRLQQIFRAHVGLAPRTWGRLARLHQCLRLLRARSRPAWPEFALAAGFFDQSHLVNEFRGLSGLTPEQFMQRAVSGSSKTGD